jgi:hypothetical protein
MGREYDEIDDDLSRFFDAQHVFFVGTAPLSGDGLVNVSPKGGAGCFAVLGPRRVAYLDIAGSGAETIAHLRENGRICIMFCAFDGRPRIVRLHGTGRVHQTKDPGFAELLDAFHLDVAGEALRSIVDVGVDRIADSCGYSVPVMTFEGWRPHRDLWIDKKLSQSPRAIADYMLKKNSTSLDGLPAIEPGRIAEPDETGGRV